MCDRIWIFFNVSFLSSSIFLLGAKSHEFNQLIESKNFRKFSSKPRPLLWALQKCLWNNSYGPNQPKGLAFWHQVFEENPAPSPHLRIQAGRAILKRYYLTSTSPSSSSGSSFSSSPPPSSGSVSSSNSSSNLNSTPSGNTSFSISSPTPLCSTPSSSSSVTSTPLSSTPSSFFSIPMEMDPISLSLPASPLTSTPNSSKETKEEKISDHSDWQACPNIRSISQFRDQYLPSLEAYLRNKMPYDQRSAWPSRKLWNLLGQQGWAILRDVVPWAVLDVLHKKLFTLCGSKKGLWKKLSGGGLIFGADFTGSGNLLKPKDVEAQRRKDWGLFVKWIHDELGPELLGLGWVRVKEGYRYRVAGGSFLLYLDETAPQTFHADSGDAKTLSILIPLTEMCLPPEFASPEHQIFKLLEEKFGKGATSHHY